MSAHRQTIETRKKISKSITGMKRSETDLLTICNAHRNNRPGTTKYIKMDETVALEYLQQEGYIDEDGTILYNPETCLPYRKQDLFEALKKHFLEYSVKAVFEALETLNLTYTWHIEHLGRINYERSILFKEYKESGGELGYYRWLTQVLHKKN